MVNVENIEEMFKEMNFHMVQQKGDKGLSQEYKKYRTVQHKRGNKHSPRLHLHL